MNIFCYATTYYCVAVTQPVVKKQTHASMHFYVEPCKIAVLVTIDLKVPGNYVPCHHCSPHSSSVHNGNFLRQLQHYLVETCISSKEVHSRPNQFD